MRIQSRSDVYFVSGTEFDDEFILDNANHSVAGGDGHDVLRYDVQADVVTSDNWVSIGPNSATRIWNNELFYHVYSGIEEFIGGSGGYTTFSGDDSNNIFRSGGGNTFYYASHGFDLFEGGRGMDVFVSGYRLDEIGIARTPNGALTIMTDWALTEVQGSIEGYELASEMFGESEIEARIGQRIENTHIAQNTTNFTEFYDATTGYNTINYSNVTDGSAFLYYDLLTLGAQFDIDSVANVGTVDKGPLGFDTFVDVANPISMEGPAGGLNIIGTSGDDLFNVIVKEGGYAAVEGYRGNDVFNLFGPGGIRVSYGNTHMENGLIVDLNTGVVSNDGYGGRDQINFEGTGAFQFYGSRLTDTILGSSRDEAFIGDMGDDTIDGGGGADLIRFDRLRVGSVFVDLSVHSASGIWRDEAFRYTLFNIENVRGSLEGDDTLVGTNGNNHIQAYSGDDRLIGLMGDDTLIGGGGNDAAIFGISSADALLALEGTNLVLSSSEGVDVIAPDIETLQFSDQSLGFVEALALLGGIATVGGSDRNDHLTGSIGAEWLDGGIGNDWIDAGIGQDTINGGAGTDMSSFSDHAQAVIVDLGAGTVRSGADTNQIINIENVTGSIYSDFFTGDDGANWFRGLGGYDWFIATNGNDTYDGSNGRDMVTYIYADAGVTIDLGQQRGLAGQAAGHSYVQIERATGTVYDDVFYGSAGSDEFRGAGGYDLFIDSGARDRYDGGTGLDTVSYVLYAQGVDASLLRGSGGRDRDLYISIENLIGSNRDDSLSGDHGRNVLRGGHGNDTLAGNGGNDYLEGGTGNDVLDGGVGYDVALYRGAAADYTVSTAGGITTVRHITDGIDTLIGVEALRFADGFDYL